MIQLAQRCETNVSHLAYQNLCVVLHFHGSKRHSNECVVCTPRNQKYNTHFELQTFKVIICIIELHCDAALEVLYVLRVDEESSACLYLLEFFKTTASLKRAF